MVFEKSNKWSKMKSRYLLSDDTWDNEELEAIQEVIESRRFTMGPKIKEFEEKFAKYLDQNMLLWLIQVLPQIYWQYHLLYIQED